MKAVLRLTDQNIPIVKSITRTEERATSSRTGRQTGPRLPRSGTTAFLITIYFGLTLIMLTPLSVRHASARTPIIRACVHGFKLYVCVNSAITATHVNALPQQTQYCIVTGFHTTLKLRSYCLCCMKAAKQRLSTYKENTASRIEIIYRLLPIARL